MTKYLSLYGGNIVNDCWGREEANEMLIEEKSIADFLGDQYTPHSDFKCKRSESKGEKGGRMITDKTCDKRQNANSKIIWLATIDLK